MVPRPTPKITERMSRITYKIAVMSGKGGVGKSTVSVNIAQALAETGAKVGILDVDIHGPNVPTMMGVEGERFVTREQDDGETTIIEPIVADAEIRLASVGLIGYDRDSALIWRGPMKLGLIKQFLEDVEWGDLDYLIIDTPPGTGDEVMTVCQYIPELSGAVVVTTPQAVSVLDARKSVDFAKKAGVPVLGMVENMSDPVDGPKLFGSGGGRTAASELNIPFLGAIPMDGEVVPAGDAGVPVVRRNPDGAAALAIHSLTNSMRLELAKRS